MSLKRSTLSEAVPARVERESGVELLRILAACGVIVLHYNNGLYGAALVHSTGVNHAFLMGLEELFIPAVNVFIIIFGYFNCVRQQVRWKRALELIVQVILFNAAFFLLRCVLGASFSVSGLLQALLPTNYFVVFYCVLYLLSPFINALLRRLQERELLLLTALLFLIFSVYQSAVDVLQATTGNAYIGLGPVGIDGGQNGYTVVNFFLCYVLGAFLRLSPAAERISAPRAAAALAVSFCAVTLWSSLDTATAWAYCNPFVILEGAAAFMLFKRLTFRSRVVNGLSKSCFTCYLLHLFLLMHCRVPWAAGQPFPVLLGHLLLTVVVLYGICWAADFVYHKITDPAFRRLRPRQGSIEVSENN